VGDVGQPFSDPLQTLEKGGEKKKKKVETTMVPIESLLFVFGFHGYSWIHGESAHFQQEY